MDGLVIYVARRLFWLPIVLLIVSLATFALGRFGPGDPVTARLGSRYDPEVAERIRHELGYDRPLYIQYLDWLGGVLRGDLGETTQYQGYTVAEVIFPKIWVSVQLGLVALLLTFGLGIPLGIWSAVNQGRWVDPFSINAFIFFQSMPVIITLPVLQWIFAVRLGWLPAAGWDGILDRHIILPAVVLSLPGVASVGRLMRANTLAVLHEEYVRTARAKGLREFTVVSRHVARNAMLPMVTVVGLSMVTLLEGAFFTETLYGIPGIGQFAVTSIGARDYDVFMALTLILAAAFVIANLAIDLTYAFIDPRVRLSGER